MAKQKDITAEEFDRMFDEGEDISAYVDFKNMREIGHELKRINVDLPTWVVNNLDLEATDRGVTRQSIIKMWLVDRIRQEEDLRYARRAASQAVEKVVEKPAPRRKKSGAE